MHHVNRKKLILKGIIFGIIFAAVLSVLIFFLWNWLMPVIFKLPEINVFQAFGILILSKILFLGFHRHSGSPINFKSREYWIKRFQEEHKEHDESINGETV